MAKTIDKNIGAKSYAVLDRDGNISIEFKYYDDLLDYLLYRVDLLVDKVDILVGAPYWYKMRGVWVVDNDCIVGIVG